MVVLLEIACVLHIQLAVLMILSKLRTTGSFKQA